MDIADIIIRLTILMGLGLLAQPLAKWLRLPFTLLLVSIGYLFSEIYIGFGFDTGIRADNFQSLVFFVFLPVLIFEAAINIHIKSLLENGFVILNLALFGMLITSLLTAGGLYYGIAHPTGFPWIAALITGALLAATDPISVVSQLKQLGVSERLCTLLEGESLFNDATAIVLFSLFLSLALVPAEPLSMVSAGGQLARVFLGGVGIGLIAGGCSILLLRALSDSLSHRLLSLITAYSPYLIAESAFHVSGITATLVAGLLFAWGNGKYVKKEEQVLTRSMWDFFGHLATLLVFLVMGITIFLDMFRERWLAMLIAIAAVLAARLISVYLSLLINNLISSKPVPGSFQPIMVWGGLRGAVTIALAFSLPVELEYWWTIQSIAFGVVLFSLFIQAPTCHLLINHVFGNQQRDRTDREQG